MDPHKIKQLRAQSALYEVVCEAIATLNDAELSGLVVLEVRLARGKSDAIIYIDGSDLDPATWPRLESRLQKASGYLSKYIVAAEGWFKAPKLHFKVDDSIQRANRMDELFDRIHKKGSDES